MQPVQVVVEDWHPRAFEGPESLKRRSLRFAVPLSGAWVRRITGAFARFAFVEQYSSAAGPLQAHRVLVPLTGGAWACLANAQAHGRCLHAHALVVQLLLCLSFDLPLCIEMAALI